MLGKIHSYETFGAADGPGVRFIVFLSGCPFRCAYCHNPDTWARPANFEATAEEVLRRALRYRSYWREEGGLTVSGGEPMLQAPFVTELFEKCHEAGVNTCLDTAGATFLDDTENAKKLLAVTDTVLLDLKQIDEEKHLALTGRSNAAPIACAKYLAEIGKRVWIRHVLVPGVTDSEDDLLRLGEFIRTLPNVEKVDILPYHVFGVEKWKALGIPYTLEDVEPPTAESVSLARRLVALG